MIVYNKKQKRPKKNTYPPIWDLVIRDMKDRDLIGFKKYKTRLQPFNGRDSLVDAYQEVLDSAVYLRQLLYERDGQ